MASRICDHEVTVANTIPGNVRSPHNWLAEVQEILIYTRVPSNRTVIGRFFPGLVLFKVRFSTKQANKLKKEE